MKVFNETPFRHAWARGTVSSPNDVLTLIVKGTFRARHNRRALPLERRDQEHPRLRRPYHDGAHTSSHYPGDFATFKPVGESMAVGSCHAPDGIPVPRVDVAFTIGNHRKVLAVFGDRYWIEGEDGRFTMTEPEPFTRMPLRYENAFGGVDYIHNPLGKGRYNVWDLYPDGRIPVPNVEDPERLIRDIEDEPPVVGFAPLSEWSPLRQEKMGAMGVDWMRRERPRKPVDFDWTSYNAAPEDQQAMGFYRGDEVLTFENMHPDFNPFRVRLAEVRVRLFVNRLEPDGSLTFFEPPMNLDTVWVDVDAEKLVQVWRGVARVSSFEYRKELPHVLIVQEDLDEEPLPLEHYRAVMERHVHPPETAQARAVRQRLEGAMAQAKEMIAGLGLSEGDLAELRRIDEPTRFLDAMVTHIYKNIGLPYPPPADWELPADPRDRSAWKDETKEKILKALEESWRQRKGGEGGS
ncbi:DUF2169 family type VI secretion system accessory protein [Azospirillum sp. ST 5-10]|uniref:DUF2169 family type VI secretion system accessory protein n=1 Tax=unclassified Azospirillum TaxID=2630922 RepID=UPI003F4A2E89